MPPHQDLPLCPSLNPGLRSIAARQCGLLSSSQLAVSGVSRAAIVRKVKRGLWQRPTRGVVDVGLVPFAELPLDVRAKRSVVLALLAYGPRAVAVGLSALILHQSWGVPAGAAPTITVPGTTHRAGRSGLVVRRFGFDDIVTVGGFRAVNPVVALAQAMPEVAARTALGLIDSVLNRQLIARHEVAQVRARAAGRRGAARLRSVWGMVDGRRASPPESWAWFDLCEAGLRPTDVQVVIRDEAGQFLARADIGFHLDDGTWLLIEINGREYHDGWDAIVADGRRISALHATGRVTVLTYVSADLGPHGLMVRQVGTFLAERRWRTS